MNDTKIDLNIPHKKVNIILMMVNVYLRLTTIEKHIFL
jgi:hypothetical protein